MSGAKVKSEGQRLRLDTVAASASTELPAFLARPADSPAYHGFPILDGSVLDGFVFGVITEPNGATPASWGDANVVAPNGSRAGIVWSAGSGPSEAVLPELKAYFAEAARQCPESTQDRQSGGTCSLCS